jgi:heme exporter protein B
VNQFWKLVARDLRLAVREGGAVGTALGFFLVVVALMPLGLGPDLNLLSRIASGVLWIALLLAALLSLGRIFETDYDDGTLEVLATGALPLQAVTAAKALAHWLSTGIPLALLAPLLGILLNLDLKATPALVATMLAGTPAVSFLGSIGAALTLKARKGGLLLALVVLPLYVPTLIFGISAVSAVTLGTGAFQASFLILVAISLASVVIGPIAAAAALRLQLE